MPTPEEQAQIDQWLAAMQSAGGAGAMFGAPNLAAATTAAQNTPEGQFATWADAMQRAGGAQALFSAENINATPQAQSARAYDAEEARINGVNSRFGNDLSWLDPTFQYNPALLAQSAGSQAFTDPALQQAQYGLLGQNQALANQQLAFQNPSQQAGLAAQWAQIQGGQGAPQFMGGGTQQQLMQQLLGMAGNTGPGALQFDNGARQNEQYGNLQGIIAGGGATAIEMADRARARGDSEAWLRGQREADMADYAERGLTGSGMELLALSSDRQAAAGRNSLADLETSKALEERRLGAINSASELATNARGQTVDEQALLGQARSAGLSGAASLANNMREADYNERSYLDKRTLDALSQQTDLSTEMRDQLYRESVAGRNAQQSALDSAAQIANQARTSQAQEGQYRATAEDDRLQLNQSAINKAASENTAYRQQARDTMLQNRQDWESLMAQLGIRTAEGLLDTDVRENQYQSGQATGLASNNAATKNTASSEYRGDLLGAATAGNAGVNAAQIASNQLYPQLGAWAGDVAGTVGSMGINAGTGASGGGGGTSGWSPQSGYSTQVAGAPLSNQGGTWASPQQGAFLPANYDPDKLRG